MEFLNIRMVIFFFKKLNWYIQISIMENLIS